MKTNLPTLAALAFLSTATAHAAIPALTLKPVSLNQLQAPTTITNAGDGSGRLFICEQRGRIRIFRNGMLQPALFLDLSTKLVSERAGFDERGLIGMAFHPGYGNSASPGYRRFYVFYSAPSPNSPGPASNPVDCRTTVSEFLVSLADPNVADLASERILLTFDKPQFNHNGGQLDFGPDGLLYIATGDGGSSNDNNVGHTGGSSARPTSALGNAQDRTNLLGNVLRIDPLGTNGPGGQYGIPVGNPFIGAGGGVREEIYAFGLRNPWRFSFDTGPGGTNRLFVADVGQGRIEEVNVVTIGGNYGWRYLEGIENPSFSSGAVTPNIPMPHPGGTLITPIAMYAHPGVTSGSPALPQLGVSITGGFVYRGTAIPGLQGKYIFADYSNSASLARGIMLGIEETSPNVWTGVNVLTLTNGNPLSTRIYAMGRDEQGEIYVATNTTLAASAPDPTTGLPAGGMYKIVAPVTATTAVEPSKDNTIYSESPANSSGQGTQLFAGRISTGALRRALLAFDLSTVPPGALPTAATLTLTMDRTTAPAANFSLHRATESWGEGASDAGDPGGLGVPAQPGDATWSDRFFGTQAWTTAGGSFNATASATTSVAGNAAYVWGGSGLLADVQAWLTTPAQNAGWVLIGNETVTSAKRFLSGEDLLPAARPKLAVTHLSAPPLTRRDSWLQQYFFVGQFVDDFADLDGDGNGNQIEYALGHSPLAPGPPPVSTAVSVDGATFTVTFRRDPRATDLTYRLQTSGDLLTWTTIVESIAGAAPANPAVVSDAEIAPEAPMRLVTAQETLIPGNRRFARLVILR